MRANYIEDYNTWAEEFKFSASLTVRFSDIDLYGIVNNSVTISYMEFARIEYFKHIGLMSDWLNPEGEKIPVVADVQCDYLKPITYNENLRIFVKPNSIRNSSVDLHYMAKNENDEILFTGRGTLVQINRQSGKGTPWSEKEKSLFVG
ncbi:acyl-CoA thioesterase [Sporosarcina sp. Marseille-Q4063]|uniref:acyl-CoA thioesterase n=1 Tax=Sporosarcina sp. Marseille-Q4063 TaxID=2810514 RepID=UPI001BAF5BFB|nr:acyl-CoA thioesterase [Sporosarcina sp. Marseille-Q4063]QUW22570.1 acyl-CoA thioesterase [Sporosarcina sp. Marseille-Q4063]